MTSKDKRQEEKPYTFKVKGTITDSQGNTMDFDESNVTYINVKDPPQKRHFIIKDIDDNE